MKYYLIGFDKNGMSRCGTDYTRIVHGNYTESRIAALLMYRICRDIDLH